MIWLMYPERGQVSEAMLLSWAKDCFLDEKIDEEPKNVEEAIKALEDLGLITVDVRKTAGSY